jgi:hypothetical protein
MTFVIYAKLTKMQRNDVGNFVYITEYIYFQPWYFYQKILISFFVFNQGVYKRAN